MRQLFWCALSLCFGALAMPAQVGEKPTNPPVVDAAKKPMSKPKISDAARTAMASARELENQVKGADGPAKTTALQSAAAAWDKIAAEFGAEPSVAAQAAFHGGELWQRNGNLAQAEQDFLLAARLDGPRYGQRGLCEAAEMQRRQKRVDEAMTTLTQAIAADPGSTRAHEGRIALGRMLQGLGRLDESVGAFRKAVDGATKPKQSIEALNYLAKVLVQKGDLDSAEQALTHADEVIQKAIAADAAQGERLQKSLDSMSARKAIQRARDKQSSAGRDARALEEARGSGAGK